MTCAAWTNWDHAQGLLLPECLPYVSFGISILSPSLKSLFGSFHPLGSHLWVPCSFSPPRTPSLAPTAVLSSFSAHFPSQLLAWSPVYGHPPPIPPTHHQMPTSLRPCLLPPTHTLSTPMSGLDYKIFAHLLLSG